jgi:hypothetical protein
MRKFIGITIVGYISLAPAIFIVLFIKSLGAPAWLLVTVYFIAHSHICYYFFDQIDAEKLKLRKKQLLTKKIDLEKFIHIMSVYFISVVFWIPFALGFWALMIPFMVFSINIDWLLGIVFQIILFQTYYSFFIGHYEMITE